MGEDGIEAGAGGGAAVLRVLREQDKALRFVPENRVEKRVHHFKNYSRVYITHFSISASVFSVSGFT